MVMKEKKMTKFFFPFKKLRFYVGGRAVKTSGSSSKNEDVYLSFLMDFFVLLFLCRNFFLFTPQGKENMERLISSARIFC